MFFIIVGLLNQPEWIYNTIMGKSWRLPDAASNILLVIILVAIWMLFAPVKLGGQDSYVLVDGTSMLPNFHTGDLAIVRPAPAYQVGDIVTYLDALTHAPIIHRIIGTQQERFVMKGDNNAWIDPYQPNRADILGKLWLHLPRVGLAMLWIRAPIHLALVTALLGGFFMVTMTTQKQKKHGRNKNTASGNLAGFEMALYLFGVLGLGFLALAIFVFIRPALIKADAIPYQQSGNFAYSAAGTASVYDTGAAVSGEPVFTKLTCKLNLAFAYTLQGPQMTSISGLQQIYAIVQDTGSGWQRTIPITADAKFTGKTVTSQATLDLCQVQTLLASVAKETGVGFGSPNLVIVAHISVGGKMAGQAFTDTFEPHLAFGFNGLQLSLAENSSQTNPLQTVQPGLLPNTTMVDNTFPLFGLKPTVGKIRLVALIGLGSTLAGLLALGIYSYSVSRRSEESIIHLKYSNLLIGVYEQGLESLSPVIDVTSIDDLARLAERQNAMIMHLAHEDVHYYLVQVEGKTYRYMTGQDRSTIPG
jgi:signal peptidase I